MLNRLTASGMMPGGGGGGDRGLSGATVAAAANPAAVISRPVVPNTADSGDPASEDEAIRATHAAAARKQPLPPLPNFPPGWQMSKSTTGRIYYQNATTGEQQWDMPAMPEPKKKWDVIRKEVVKDSFGDLLRNVVALARQRYAEEVSAVSKLFGSSCMRSEGGRSKFEIPMLSKYEFEDAPKNPLHKQRFCEKSDRLDACASETPVSEVEYDDFSKEGLTMPESCQILVDDAEQNGNALQTRPTTDKSEAPKPWDSEADKVMQSTMMKAGLKMETARKPAPPKINRASEVNEGIQLAMRNAGPKLECGSMPTQPAPPKIKREPSMISRAHSSSAVKFLSKTVKKNEMKKDGADDRQLLSLSRIKNSKKMARETSVAKSQSVKNTTFPGIAVPEHVGQKLEMLRAETAGPWQSNDTDAWDEIEEESAESGGRNMRLLAEAEFAAAQKAKQDDADSAALFAAKQAAIWEQMSHETAGKLSLQRVVSAKHQLWGTPKSAHANQLLLKLSMAFSKVPRPSAAIYTAAEYVCGLDALDWQHLVESAELHANNVSLWSGGQSWCASIENMDREMAIQEDNSADALFSDGAPGGAQKAIDNEQHYEVEQKSYRSSRLPDMDLANAVATRNVPDVSLPVQVICIENHAQRDHATSEGSMSMSELQSKSLISPVSRPRTNQPPTTGRESDEEWNDDNDLAENLDAKGKAHGGEFSDRSASRDYAHTNITMNAWDHCGSKLSAGHETRWTDAHDAAGSFLDARLKPENKAHCSSPRFKTACQAKLDRTKHVDVIARVAGLLPVTMMYEEVYKEDLCEPGEVFFKLAYIERSVLGMRARALSKTVLAFHLIRSSNFPYGICSYQISSNTITVQIIHGKDVHTLFRVKSDDIITEELSQIDSCLLVVKKSAPAMRVMMLRDTWKKVTRKIEMLSEKSSPWSPDSGAGISSITVGNSIEVFDQSSPASTHARSLVDFTRDSHLAPSCFEHLTSMRPPAGASNQGFSPTLNPKSPDRNSRNQMWKEASGNKFARITSLDSSDAKVKTQWQCARQSALAIHLQDMQPSNYFFWPAMEISTPLVTCDDKNEPLPTGALCNVSTWSANCVFDINRALNAHRLLDKICTDHFFGPPAPVPKSPNDTEIRPGRIDPFAVIRFRIEEVAKSRELDLANWEMTGTPMNLLNKKIFKVSQHSRHDLCPALALHNDAPTLISNGHQKIWSMNSPGGVDVRGWTAATGASGSCSPTEEISSQQRKREDIGVPRPRRNAPKLAPRPPKHRRQHHFGNSETPRAALGVPRGANAPDSFENKHLQANDPSISDVMTLYAGTTLQVLVKQHSAMSNYDQVDEIEIRPSESPVSNLALSPRNISSTEPLPVIGTGLLSSVQKNTALTIKSYSAATEKESSDSSLMHQPSGALTVNIPYCLQRSIASSSCDDLVRVLYFGPVHTALLLCRNEPVLLQGYFCVHRKQRVRAQQLLGRWTEAPLRGNLRLF